MTGPLFSAAAISVGSGWVHYAYCVLGDRCRWYVRPSAEPAEFAYRCFDQGICREMVVDIDRYRVPEGLGVALGDQAPVP
jgi:hypothetical protein